MIPGSKNDHPTLKKSFAFAVQGLRTALRTERNLKIMLAAAGAVVAAGLVLGLDTHSWAVLLLSCGAVLCAELFNTSIETIVDLVSPEFHPLAGRAKDISAAAVWVLCVFVAALGLVIFFAAIRTRFGW